MTDAEARKLEYKVKKALALVRQVNKRCADILAARNHYLRHRAPGVLKRQKIMLRTLEKTAKKFDAIPRLSLQVTHKARNKDKQNVLLMVTSNQARKLRAIADADLRPLLKGLGNARAGKRVSLKYTPYGKKMAKHNAHQSKNRLSNAVHDVLKEE